MHSAQGPVPDGATSTSIPTAYSPGLQKLPELPGFTLVQGPCVVPGGTAVAGAAVCARAPAFDAMMMTAKATSFTGGFTVTLPSPLGSARHATKLSSPQALSSPETIPRTAGADCACKPPISCSPVDSAVSPWPV